MYELNLKTLARGRPENRETLEDSYAGKESEEGLCDGDCPCV